MFEMVGLLLIFTNELDGPIYLIEDPGAPDLKLEEENWIPVR